VNGADLAFVIGDWGSASPRSDMNRDGSVDGVDLGLVLAHWTNPA
jgi:hypothetical protein